LPSFIKKLFERGVAIVSGVFPATSLWYVEKQFAISMELTMRFRGCRVRMCVFATLSWADLHTALNVAIDICFKIGVIGVQRVSLDSPAALAVAMSESALVLQQSQCTDKALSELVLDLAKTRVDTDRGIGSHPLVLSAGTAALKL
jgi:serine palmitoyltransferase